mgnify:CR=1 FL=1
MARTIDILFLYLLCAVGLHAAMLGQWSFDSNFQDTSGNGNHLSAQLGSVSIASGLVNNAANFQKNSYLSLVSSSLNANFTSFSLGAWVYIDPSIAATACDAGLVAQSNLAYGLTYHGNGRLYSYVCGGSTSLSHSISTGVWHHVAQTFDGDTMYLYIDGVLVGSRLAISSSMEERHSTGAGQELRIGNSYTYSNDTLLYGMVDEVFFTTDVLSLSQINGIYSSIPETGTFYSLAIAIFILAFLRYVHI